MIREYILYVLFVPTIINCMAVETDPQRASGGDQNRINKCCPMGKIVGERKDCVSYNDRLNFSNIEIYDEYKRRTVKSLEDVFSFVPSKFEDEYFIESSVDIVLMKYNVFLIENGELKLELPNTYDRWISLSPANYCVDYRIISQPMVITPRFYGILPGIEFSDSNPYLTYAMLVSCFFMLLVLIVYFLLPELQNLSGMILMAYVASLFMAFLLLSILQLIIFTEEACVGLTLGIYFFFLATFCWMNVMSYDIWWTFRGLAYSRKINRRGERFKFLMYCLYAWGIPLAMTIGLGMLNTIKNGLRHLPWFIIPSIPEYGCFLQGGVKLLYLYTPMLILIISNWMFYLMTAFNLWRLNKGTAILDTASAGNPQAHRRQRQRLMVYVKLSLVMGLNWFQEILSFQYPGFKILWILTDAYNIFMGLAIFLIFVCKKEILRKLCKRFGGRNTIHFFTTFKRSSQGTSNSSHETSALRSEVSSQPNGPNSYALISLRNIND